MIQKKLTEKEIKDNLATFGVEDPKVIEISEEDLKSVDGKVMTGEDWLKNNPPLETPTFFSTQKD